VKTVLAIMFTGVESAIALAMWALRLMTTDELRDFGERLAHVTVLDPACGSGNFLYVAINLLLDLAEVSYISSAGIRALNDSFKLLRTGAPEENDEAMAKGAAFLISEGLR